MTTARPLPTPAGCSFWLLIPWLLGSAVTHLHTLRIEVGALVREAVGKFQRKAKVVIVVVCHDDEWGIIEFPSPFERNGRQGKSRWGDDGDTFRTAPGIWRRGWLIGDGKFSQDERACVVLVVQKDVVAENRFVQRRRGVGIEDRWT